MARPPADPSTRQLYRSMRPTDLILLREAFIGDAQETASVIIRSFCAERIGLIGAILKEKASLAKFRADRRAERKAQRERSERHEQREETQATDTPAGHARRGDC
jgi:hypothetical protein